MNRMKKTLLTTLLAVLTLAAGAQSETEKPLLTLACISDIHTERSLIDCDLSSIAVRGSFTKTVNLIKQNEQIDVMLLGGDCTSDATIAESNWKQARKLIVQCTRKAFPTTTSTPVIYVTGNHDYEVANWDNIPKPYNAGDYYTYPMKNDIGELTEVADAGRGAGTLARTLQSGQQHGRQDRDDTNDDQQLNEGKRLFAMFHFELTFRLVCFVYVMFVCFEGQALSRDGKQRALYIIPDFLRNANGKSPKNRKKNAVFGKKLGFQSVLKPGPAIFRFIFSAGTDRICSLSPPS